MTEKKEPVKKVSPRRRARECAVQALYSWALSGNAPEQVELTFVVDQDLKGVDKPYFSRLFRQTVANVDAVDFLRAGGNSPALLHAILFLPS